PLIGTVVGGRYEIVRLIGKGGMGAIYEVRNTRLGRQFALKTLTGDAAANPEVLLRFRREADVIAKIKHPNIVEVIDWESLADGSPAMVMEYLHGEDLGERIKEGPLRWPQIARIADQVLAALSVAHANGIVHRDLKPQNIFLAQDDSGDERVKLLDFGVSKVRDSKSLVTTDARLLGTPAYMSPEQSEGRAEDVGTHSDVWAMGAILYEMATGEVPFDADNLPAILYKICHSKAAPITKKRADAPEPFIELVDETLERDISKRISDATVLRVRLREALRNLAGVQFVDTLPGLRTSAQMAASGRRKRMTDAMSDTIGAITPPKGNLAVGTPVEKSLKVGTENTLLATKDSPSVIARKKWRPAAVVIGALAIAMVAGAVVIATQRGGKSTPAAATPVAKPADQTPQIDAGAVVATPPPAPDAAVAVAADPADPPKPDPKQRPIKKKDPKTNTAKIDPKQDPAKTEPKQDPVKTEPKQEPAKKKCAKDDFECLYGDGT
ncbi:MAG TPA: serine/threonine-protein kinase, partial [Kofleriaceae bacterium]|nr:serine/threonine-protein kinase [Kofleriaceae bacterium]